MLPVSSPSGSLEPLFQAAAGLVPGMIGRTGPPLNSHVTVGADNRAALQALADGIRVRHPAAGPGYWALRSWNMLEWQPVVLTLLGVHGLGLLPVLEGMGQRVRDGGVMGYRLPDRPPITGPTRELIDRGGRQLRALADGLLGDLGAVIRVKPLLARRLLADRVLGVLLELAAHRPDLSTATVQDQARHWLTALDLEGQSALMVIHRRTGGQGLALNRRACCLAYRTDTGIYCDSCPRLPLEERLRRAQDR